MSKQETACIGLYIENDAQVSSIPTKIHGVSVDSASTTLSLYNSADNSGDVLIRIVTPATDYHQEIMFDTPVHFTTACYAEITSDKKATIL